MKTRLCSTNIDTDLDAALFTAGGVVYHIHQGEIRPIYYGVKIRGGQTVPADLTGPFSGDVLVDRLQAAFANTSGLDVAGILTRAGLALDLAELAASGALRGTLDAVTD
jgi:hypothetical protein